MQISAYNFEIRRKIFHLYSLVLPIIYCFISKTFVVSLLLFVTTITLYFDVARHYNPKIENFTNKFFAHLMRQSEQSGSFKLSSASYMMSGFFLGALFFSKGLAITAWLILIISDCLAAIVGTKIGTPRENGKSLEGSIAFFISAIIISLLSYSFIGFATTFPTILVSCAIITASEYYSKQILIDDNLFIPVGYGFLICFFRLIF